MDDLVLSPGEAATFLKVPEGTLKSWRHQEGKGPKFSTLGKRVVYRKSRLLEYLEQQESAQLRRSRKAS